MNSTSARRKARRPISIASSRKTEISACPLGHDQFLRPHGIVAARADDDRRRLGVQGSSEFTVKIDPANEGVKIRRRVNRNRSNVQRTDVYVDGQLIADAPWYVCDLPDHARDGLPRHRL